MSFWNEGIHPITGFGRVTQNRTEPETDTKDKYLVAHPTIDYRPFATCYNRLSPSLLSRRWTEDYMYYAIYPKDYWANFHHVMEALRNKSRYY